MLFVDSIRDLSSLSKEIEVLACAARATYTLGAATKGVIVEVIASFLQLITKTIVGIFEVNSVSMC
jgi:hypothetical protein